MPEYNPDDMVTIRWGTFCTDIMAAVHHGALDREYVVLDVAAMKAGKLLSKMDEKGHFKKSTHMNNSEEGQHG